MLETLRRISKGWIMKTILGVLALSFVVFFGATDFGGGRGGGRNANAVVEVADLDFSLRDVSNEYNVQLQQITQTTGQPVDPSSPIAAALLEQSITALVTRALYDAAAQDLGIAASDAAVRDAIQRVPAFIGPGGSFDRALFGNFLRQVGLSEQQFIASARADLLRSQYLGTLRAGINVPAPMLDAIYRYRFEQRVVELVKISSATVEGLSQPDESQIAEFYEEIKQFLQAPEYRAATIAAISLDDFAATIEIEDEEVAEVYAERLDLFQTPERREILQAIFLDQESAERAADMMTQGRPFAEVVETVAGFPPVEMGTVGRAEIIEPELADAAFSIAPGEATAPIETALGWQILSVVSITPEETRPLAEVADELRQAIAVQQARDDIFDLLNAVEDGLAAGLSLEEVARENGLEVQKLGPFSDRGVLRSGDQVDVGPITDEVIGAAFRTGEGEIGDVVETQDGGFFVARTDSITPRQIEPLENVRDTVTAAWLDQQRLDRAVARATELAERARAGDSMEELAEEFGGEFEVTQPFDRTGLGSTIAGPLITPIFAANEGDIVQAQLPDGAGVARLIEIRKVEGTGDELDRDELRAELADSINRDTAQQLTTALRERYSIDIDRETIEDSLLTQ